MNSHHPAEIGTAFFPEPDVVPNGTPRQGSDGRDTRRLHGLPRRRRPAMLALAIAMVGAGVLASAAVYQRIDRQISVITLTRSIPAGSVISSADLSTTDITVGAGIDVIPAKQIDQVTGEIAAVTLRPSTLLAASDLTTTRLPAPGQDLIAAPTKPYALPTSGLGPGDHILIIATPGQQGQPGAATGAPPLNAPVPGVVESVTNVPDEDGFDVVDLLVADRNAPAAASQISTGQFALIVTRRG
jgi:SAF domain